MSNSVPTESCKKIATNIEQAGRGLRAAFSDVLGPGGPTHTTLVVLTSVQAYLAEATAELANELYAPPEPKSQLLVPSGLVVPRA